jgi:hypothetical protein
MTSSQRSSSTGLDSTSATYLAAERNWQQLLAHSSSRTSPELTLAAHQYVRSIDLYLADLVARGWQVPFELDKLAETLRAEFGDAPFVQVAAADTITAMAVPTVIVSGGGVAVFVADESDPGPTAGRAHDPATALNRTGERR